MLKYLNQQDEPLYRPTTTVGGGTSEPILVSVSKTITRVQGGILLTLGGAELTGTTGVTIGGTACTAVTVVDDNTVTCVTPTKAAGTYALVLTNGVGTATLSIKFVSPLSIFAANLKRWYSETYAAGVWTDESGGGDTSQATAAMRPAASTFAATADRPATHVALLFDGVNDSLNMGGDVELFTTEGLVACIVLTSDLAGAKVAVGKLYTTDEAYTLGSDFGISNKRMAFGVGGTTATELAASGSDLDDGNVHRAVGVLSAGTSRLYIDSALQADTGSYPSVPNKTNFASIGAGMSTAENVTSDFWNGKIGEVVVANVAPSAVQLAELHAYLRDCAGAAA